MNPNAETVYQERNSAGIYKDLVKQIRRADEGAYLATSEVGVHIVRSSSAKKGFISYHNATTHEEHSCLVVGEIGTAAEGTQNGAKGNHYSGGETALTDTHATVKDSYVLRRPTLAKGKINTVYENQLAACQDLRDADEAAEAKSGQHATFTKDLLRAVPDSDDFENLTITIGPKFKLPDMWPEGKSRRYKRRCVADSDDEDSEDDQDENSAMSNAGDEAATVDTLSVELGALYPCELLPDHRGPYFKQRHAQLHQNDIRDVDGNLIPPWQVYDKLRAGTLILAQVTIVCWIIKDKDGGKGFKKVYQMNAHSIRVIAESGEDMEERPIPTLIKKEPGSSSKSVHSTPSRSSSSSQALANFESPTKKRRL